MRVQGQSAGYSCGVGHFVHDISVKMLISRHPEVHVPPAQCPACAEASLDVALQAPLTAPPSTCSPSSSLDNTTFIVVASSVQ